MLADLHAADLTSAVSNLIYAALFDHVFKELI